VTEQPPTSGFGPDKLHHLLRICSQADPAEGKTDSNQRKAELLQDMLAETLPVETLVNNLPEELTTLCQISGIASEESVRDLLTKPKTDVGQLRIMRDYFKKKSKCARSEAEQAATTVYYAALAYALVVHGLKITKFSYEDLHRAFSRLANTDWVPSAVSGLFRRACEYCRGKLQM